MSARRRGLREAVRAFLAPDLARFLAGAFVGTGLVALVTFAAGVAKILPNLLQPDVPARAARPFLEGVASLSIEIGALVGWPLGWAEVAVRSRERGEARARMALGEAPWRRMTRLLPATFVLTAVTALGSLAWGKDARAPGRIARALVDEGRASCVRFATSHHAGEASVVTVPLVRASWLCRGADPRAPMLVGEGTGGASAIDFGASSLSIGDDLTTFVATDAQILIPTTPPARLRVKEARIRGIAPYTVPSSVSPIARALAIAASAIVASLLTTISALRGEAPVRAGAWAIAVVGPAAALVALRACEQAGATGWRLASLPVAAAVAVLLARAIARGIDVISAHRRRAAPKPSAPA